MNKRLLSMFLALCMIVSMLPVTALAEEIHTTIGGSGEIISFAPLTETEKTVSPGKSGENLELPETLTATVRTAVPADENPVQDSGSPQTATPATTTEPQWEETTVDIPVRWVSPGYDMNTEGEYVFTPEIESYTVSTPLPEIVVTVGEMPPLAAARGLVTPMSATTYGICVGGVEVTSENKEDVLGAADGEGATVTYDSATNTLTLNGATITAYYTQGNYDYGIYQSSSSTVNNLCIRLAGTNTITLNVRESQTVAGIYSEKSGGNLTFCETENGSLNTSAPNMAIYGETAITISSGTINAIGGPVGIYSNGQMTINGGNVIADGTMYGIVCRDSLSITSGTLTATGGTNAIVFTSGSLSPGDGMQVRASANKNGTPVDSYDAASLANYKYIKVEPGATPPVFSEVGDPIALQSAITSATGDLNLKLSDSYSGTGIITIPSTFIHNITIDLNGKTLDGNYNYAISHEGSGTLTITDSKGGGMVTSKTTIGTIRAGNHSTVNISGGTVSATGSSGYAIFINNAILNISGGTVSATGSNGYAIFSSNTYPQLKITGGTISAVNGTAIFFPTTTISTGGTVVIQGGTKAMQFTPTLSGGVQGGASTSYDGGGSVAYVAGNIATYKYLKFGPDVISPVLSSESVNRTSDTAATIGFTTDKAGTAYYLVVNSGASAPTSAEVKAGTSLGSVSGTVTDKAVALTAGAKDIYVVVEDSAGNISTPLKIPAAAYAAPLVNASISPDTATFDLNPNGANHTDIDVTLTPGSYEFSSIRNGGVPLLPLSHYTSNGGDSYTLKKSYLSSLGEGSATITFHMSGGTIPTLALTITDTRTALTSVAISNTTPKYGDTLSATIEPSAATVTYSWKADGSQVGTGTTYEVKAADIGKEITLTVTGTGAYKDAVTSPATSAVAARDYSVTVASSKSVAQGLGVSSLPAADAGSVNGTLTWYSNSERTTAAVDTDISALGIGGSVTLYWSFTATTAGYVTTPKTGECVVTIVSGAAQTLSFAQSTVTKTVGDPIFTNALTHSVGTGAVTYSSSNTGVATVHPTTGAVAIVGVGTTTIMANAAMVPGAYAPGSASFTLTVNAPIKSVSVGSQSGTATASTAGSLTYTVTTANIADGTYAVNVANLPVGVTIGNSGNVTISGNSGTLTLTVADTAAAGTTGTLALTLDGATSAAFSIVIGEPAPIPNLSVVDVTLDAVTVGYMSSNYKSVVITNSGDAQATISNVTTDRPSVFSIHSGQSVVAANGSINSWQIKAATGLSVGTHTATITVTYDGGLAATATVSITVNAVGNYTVTFNPNGGTVGEATRSVAPGTAVGALPTPTRSGSYSFDGWYTAASGGTQISVGTTVSANVTYYAHWTYTGGGGSGSGGGSSSNDNSSPVIVTPPAPDKPNSPTQGEIKVPGIVDGKGNVTVSLTDKTVTDAFNKALAEAKKNDTEQNGITVVLRVDTGNKTGSNVTVNLPKAVQDTIIVKKIVNTIVVVDNPDIRVGMDLATVQEINKQAKSDVNITATRGDSSKLTGDAKKAIGSRPVFDLKVNYGNGKEVSSFGAGSVSVTIPYTLGANEKAGNVQAVYVDAKGKVHWLTNSVYDSVEKVLRFSTDHFSTYGIGYKQTNTAFTDIAGHWAKGDIEFVVSRGLFSGTSETKFSPNTAMTRGMFVTALGRLANADVSGYTKSSFTDVKGDAYYMGYIEWASKNNIVNGTGNNKFAQDQSITREQMAVIMSNYAKTIGYTLPKVHIENIFTDNAKIGTYAKEAVKQMQMAGVISGKSGNLFDPQSTATRAEVSAVLRRFVELAISSDTAQGWSMNDSGK